MMGRRLSLVNLLMLWSLATPKCLREYTDIPLKRNFYYNGMSLPVILESSERASHLFVNNVLYILFNEVLKIKTVKMIHRDHPTDYINAIKRLSNLSEDGVPQSMVNLEVWLPHIFQVESENVIDAGPLGPTGMYGWFVPSVEVEKFWRNFGIIVNHWRSFTNVNVSKLFSSDVHALQTNLNAPSGGTWCDQAYDTCQKGIFVANKSFCRGVHDRNCAILFSSYAEVDKGFLVEQIEKYKLRANVAWMGDHLKCFVNKILQSNKPLVFFNWVPNDVTSSSSFELIQFPGHFVSSHSSQEPLSKQYTLKKLVWRVIKTHLPEVFHVISGLHFSKEELEHELSKFPMKWADSIVQQLACDWLKHNSEKWKSWMPLNAAKKIPIYLVGFFPKAFPSIKEGARMAVEMLNEDGSVLEDYEVILQTFTIPCDGDATPHILHAIHNNTKHVMAVIGPMCYEAAEPLASIASYFNKLVVSFGSDVSQRRRLPSDSFFDVVPSTSNNGEIYIDVIKFFNCTQLAVIVQDDEYFKEQYLTMSTKAAVNMVDIKFETVLDVEASNQKLLEVIEELKLSRLKIVMLFGGNRLSFKLLCIALEMEVSNSYVWFIPHGLVSMERYFHVGGSCSMKEVFKALRGSYVVEPSPFGSPEKRISLGDSTIKDWKELYHKRLDALAMEVNGYGSYAFDAVLTFGLALNNLILDDPSSVESINRVETLRKLSSHLKNIYLDGITGSISFKHFQRIGSFDIKQIQENATFRIIGKYDFSKNSSDRLSINASLVLPFHARLSASQVYASPMCGVESFRILLNVDCDVAIVIINLICLFLLLISAISCLIIIKRRYDRKVRTTCDRMEELGLFSQDISWLCLDQWEVPRNNVVLNRKLGEGAFGTVFGGEANIGGMWVAAAVKTLKLSSKPDEKLDFLSEAEMMKRFNHENIVKLLGVCTRGEPTLAIMEFMLHGDLKTFLLSRRQLVGQSGREAEDVSPFQLTKMALDVAHGLLYLSSLNYVHRDLACRNCLVHANKTVKIGDFGMTRSMNDSDYYRFNKRGMFPVRWMAPESLSDGLFGTTSDVWSYGVLLYEIITFGSFPYQGLSNRQVLNFVKNGNILSMPAECPPKVESLLKSCWSFDLKNRPKVLEVIEILNEMPELLTPCLDTPSTSVHIDGQWSLEINILPRVRHRNQYHKNLIVSDRMSAPNSTNNPSINIQSSRLSSPPFCHHVDDLTNEQNQTMKLGLGSCDLGAPEEFKNPDDQGSGTAIQCEMDESFFSQDTTQLCHGSINPEGKVKESSLLAVKRSLSADDKTLFDARHWGTISSRICRLYADKIRSKIEEMKKDEKNGIEKSSVKRKTLLPILSGLGEHEGFATEPRQNNRKSGVGTQQLTCDSRTDSDYCSQHSKDFSTHLGTALL